MGQNGMTNKQKECFQNKNKNLVKKKGESTKIIKY